MPHTTHQGKTTEVHNLFYRMFYVVMKDQYELSSVCYDLRGMDVSYFLGAKDNIQ
jgi:hypothetical protein